MSFVHSRFSRKRKVWIRSRIKEEPAVRKIAVLRAFRGLPPSFFQKDPKMAVRAFDLLSEKESLKARLAANNGSASSIDILESKAVLGSVEAIEHLKGFYGVLLEKADVKAQSALLEICARAPPSVLPVFLKSRDSLTGYYLAHRFGGRIPEALWRPLFLD